MSNPLSELSDQDFVKLLNEVLARPEPDYEQLAAELRRRYELFATANRRRKPVEET